jgi:hypothetical protein
MDNDRLRTHVRNLIRGKTHRPILVEVDRRKLWLSSQETLQRLLRLEELFALCDENGILITKFAEMKEGHRYFGIHTSYALAKFTLALEVKSFIDIKKRQ